VMGYVQLTTIRTSPCTERVDGIGISVRGIPCVSHSILDMSNKFITNFRVLFEFMVTTCDHTLFSINIFQSIT
jgi:hypothetical protein